MATVAEDTVRPRRQSPCKWIDRDETGRPRCEHGWAIKARTLWYCPAKKLEADRRYARSSRGREVRRRLNNTPHAKSQKALYELTRVRVR